MLRNGLDCLSELIDSLEDLCQIIQRGTYNLETWIAGMTQSASVDKISEDVEELHIRYKPIGRQKNGEYDRHEERTNITPESYLEDLSRNQILQRIRGK
ncbi:hypothetical protein [Anaerobacillus alkalidiazotrophicus]|nr:hypothetical protein [Anaerobacillus alkalidiazotrophicus]